MRRRVTRHRGGIVRPLAQRVLLVQLGERQRRTSPPRRRSRCAANIDARFSPSFRAPSYSFLASAREASYLPWNLRLLAIPMIGRRELRVHLQRLPVLGDGLVEPPHLHQQLGVGIVGVGIVRDQLDVFLERLLRPRRSVPACGRRSPRCCRRGRSRARSRWRGGTARSPCRTPAGRSTRRRAGSGPARPGDTRPRAAGRSSSCLRPGRRWRRPGPPRS